MIISQPYFIVEITIQEFVLGIAHQPFYISEWVQKPYDEDPYNPINVINHEIIKNN